MDFPKAIDKFNYASKIADDTQESDENIKKQIYYKLFATYYALKNLDAADEILGGTDLQNSSDPHQRKKILMIRSFLSGVKSLIGGDAVLAESYLKTAKANYDQNYNNDNSLIHTINGFISLCQSNQKEKKVQIQYSLKMGPSFFSLYESKDKTETQLTSNTNHHGLK